MWPPWLSSRWRSRKSATAKATPPPPRRSPTPPPLSLPPTPQSRSFGNSCSSLKDIHTLLQPEPEPTSPVSPSLFRRLRLSTSLVRSFTTRPVPSLTLPPDSDLGAAIVVYYTSLHVVRRTYNDCRAIRSILRGFSVAIDERDVFVDERFREELQKILGRRNVPLPSVFVGGVYVGGADDVRKLYDSGELQELIEKLPNSKQNACDSCGGLRFVVCDACDGSHKVFSEKSGFRSCSACNVNGLIRCPACFFVLPRHTK